MFKILMIEKNILLSKKILDYLNSIDINFKIYGFAYSMEEILNILSIQDFDLILLDIKTLENDYNSFFDFLNRNKLIKYQKSIILLIDDNKDIVKIKNNFYINNYLRKPYNQETFSKSIKQFFYNDCKNIIIDNIKAELEKLNFKYCYIGTKYLIDCIYQVSLLDNKYDFHLV